VPEGDLRPWVAAMGLLAAECLGISLAQYALFFVRAIRGPAGEGENGEEATGERDRR
jgi:hypothetical protein